MYPEPFAGAKFRGPCQLREGVLCSLGDVYIDGTDYADRKGSRGRIIDQGRSKQASKQKDFKECRSHARKKKKKKTQTSTARVSESKEVGGKEKSKNKGRQESSRLIKQVVS